MTSKVAVVATVRDEVASIEGMVSALVAGSRRPDEIVITDAGSTDGTWEELQRLAPMHPILKPFQVAGNRSVGRNLAINHATSDVIACIDGGCTPHQGWLAALTAPFEEGASWVGGFYRPASDSRRVVCIGLTMVFVLEEALEGGFLPSARSMAFTKSAFSKAGGFPEDLEVSEDTAFDEAMERAGFTFVFRPDAIVDWVPRTGSASRQRCCGPGAGVTALPGSALMGTSERSGLRCCRVLRYSGLLLSTRGLRRWGSCPSSG